jgi:DNA-binding GntR family transcriptional regulator
MQLADISGTSSLATRAYEEILTRLVDGDFPEGSRLKEGQVAESLGISRGPVRQALQRLALEGWVEIRPRSGAYVGHKDEARARDFFQVRQELEVEAAGLAAVRRTAEDIAALRACLERAEPRTEWMMNPRGEDDAARAFHREASSEFHRLVIEASHNQTLVEVLGLLVKKTVWYFTPGALKHSERAWNEHRELVDALERGDVRRSSALMDKHMAHTFDSYLEQLRRDSGKETGEGKGPAASVSA